jgi:hypothetical protein
MDVRVVSFNARSLCRQQGNKIGSTWSAVSAAYKLMQHQKQLEKDLEAASTSSDVANKEQMRLMLDAMWASNALDIQNTVSKACTLVLSPPMVNALSEAPPMHVTVW